MEEQNIDLIESNFLVRNSLVSIFEQLLFLVNTLNQNDKKLSNVKTADVNDKLKISLNELIVKLWSISKENSYYWHNCSTEVYKVFYLNNKENLIKTYGKRRFYKFLEYELNSFLNIEKTNNPKEKLFVPNVFFQDAFILLDYSKHLNEPNMSIVEFFNSEKIKFLKAEIEKDNYYVDSYESYFQIRKSVSRSSTSSEVEIHNASNTGINVENVNIINIDDKAFPLEVLNKIMNNLNAFTSQNKLYEEYPEQNLNKNGLPKFNVQTRYELLKRLKIKPLIEAIKSPTEKAKTIILGSIMDITADNARHLYNKTFKNEFTSRDEEKLNDFLKKEGVDL